MAKKDNASIVLADSIALRDNRFNFKEVSGILGKAISQQRMARESGSGQSVESIVDNAVASMPDSRVPPFMRQAPAQPVIMSPMIEIYDDE